MHNCRGCSAPISTTPGPGRPRAWCEDCRSKRRVMLGFSKAVKPSAAECSHCGEFFDITPGSGRIPRYCSPDCRKIAYNKVRNPRQCRHCNAEIRHGVSPQARYCSRDCRSAADEQRARANGAEQRYVECAFCGDPWLLDPLRPSQLRRKYCDANCTREAGRAMRRGKLAGVKVERIDRHLVFERDEYVCGICHEPVDRCLRYPDPGFASLDHVIPIARGGSHTYDNVQCSHLGCNVRKWAKILEKTPESVAKPEKTHGNDRLARYG